MRVVDRVEEILCVAIFGVMTLVAFANVITRYLIHYSLAFTEEVVVSLFVWLTFVGGALAFREGQHLMFSLLVERAPRSVRRAAIWLSAALGVGLFVVLIYYALLQIGSERQLGTTSEALAIPQWWYTGGIPVFSALAVGRIIATARRASAALAR